MTELRITVTNTSAAGGTALTPTYFGFHDGSFDLFDAGGTASAGLESLAEDGASATLSQERLAVDPDSQGLVVAGARGPIAAQEVATGTIDVDGAVNQQVSLAAMILPSNDAFIGTDDAVTLFNADGSFAGAQTINFAGTDVYDAGTEVNTEEDAAFLNQTAPNTGITENGTIQLHPGFNGSAGNPEGPQNILGGTNAFGEVVDPVAGDFTLPGAQIAEIHVNTVVVTEGSNGRDFFWGDTDDDIVTGANGRDFLFGGSGYDDLFGGNGRDFLKGGSGNDLLEGGRGRDFLKGGTGNDRLAGDEGGDLIAGGAGADVIAGGTGNDILFGGSGGDVFLFEAGDGRDRVKDFDAGEDVLSISGTGIADLAGLEEIARDRGNSLILDLEGRDTIILRNTDFDDLTDANVLFF